ncbi:MAG TPA: UvrD-helicase domain-containing protein [Gemmatimonadales bacterium]
MSLTPLLQQRRAIEAPLGPTLVVAGPGAGKTFCLIGRIQHLISTGIDPQRICTVTFTNRAAEEIAGRLKQTLGDKAEAVTRGTIHALCLALLREHTAAAGLKRGFGVADEVYQGVVLGRLRVPAERRGGVLNRFGRHRLSGYKLQPDEARLFREYCSWLAHRNMVDFDELITKAEPLAGLIADRWDYLLVDEFQDVNAVQYDFLKKLAERHGNFFAVGDDEQSIFAWTGADPYVLVRFKRDYDVEPIILDKNCRCSRQIFETARRVLAQNPQLFQKQLTADKESAHEVAAYSFHDEEEEASWLLEDIVTDGQGWGDYAILYRKHKLGEYLEGRLLCAGIPCRLARGRSLMEDAVIGYVMTALRVVRSPNDPAALHAFAQSVLSQHFLQEVEAAIGPGGGDFLVQVRALAQRRPRHDPDTKKLWRLIFQIENLRSLPRSHPTLPAVIEEILSQSIGPFKNVLEERHDELTDPAALPEAVELAKEIEQAITSEQDIVLEPRGGAEIALRGMLAAAGVRRLPSSTTHDAPRTTHVASDALTVFKALQLLSSKDIGTALERYVTFDFETTDDDVATCGVVEIGAARVVKGEIVERFHSLVNPFRPIFPRATQIHGYTDADVKDAPPFNAVLPQFLAFVGSDVLIAHNGQHFDIPVLKRLAGGDPAVANLAFYDTLLLARSLSRDRATQEELAHRFGIDAGRAHHALDDAVTLAQVYRELEKHRAVRARKAVLANVLDYLGLALALEDGPKTGERANLFNTARYQTLGRYSDALEFYAMDRERRGATAPTVEEVIQRLGGRALMMKLRAEPDPAQRYPAAVARLRALMDDGGANLEDSVDRLLERVALSKSEGEAAAPNRVNLLTLHSTKGLEFSRVYIVGVEDNELLGYQSTKDEIEEARRLLYVGMTRARDRLVLTRCERRSGRDAGGTMFLEEMGLTAPSQSAYSASSS